MTKIAIFNDTSKENHYGCSLVMKNLIRKLNKHNLKPIFFWPVGEDWRPFANKIKKKYNFQAIIVNGEGSIHNSKVRLRAKYLSQLATFAKNELKIPAYLINSTIYNNDKETYSNLNNFKRIYVRESLSLEELKKNNIQAKIVPDLSLAYPYNFNTKRKGFLVTDSVFRDVSIKLKLFCKKNKYDYEKIGNKDKSFLQKLDKRINNFIKIYNFPGKRKSKISANYNKFLNKLKKRELVLTGRFHVVTFCVLTKTPFIAIESNTHKISSITNDIFGCTKKVIATEEISKININNNYSDFLFNPLEIKKIDRYCSHGRQKIDNMFKEISRDLKNII